ncbi:hypothetical protein PENTCL1PPCAC_16970, partial [Pristionchus entomophagus]
FVVSRDIDPPCMDGNKEHRNCLICSVPISECHLGIDACRACAVFYKRICTTNRPPSKCKGGEGKCIEKDATTSCRKCRYERFAEVMGKATDTVPAPEVERIFCDPIQLRKLEERVETTFIDHTKFLLDQPSCSSSSSTPLLDKIRWSYSVLCQTRKSGETATKPVSYHLSQGEFDGTAIRFVPATYSMVVPNARIFAAALNDFATLTFPCFAKMDAVNRGWCISSCFQQVSLLDSTYRSVHHFPNDLDTYFASYTTIVNNDSINSFLNDCPFDTNEEEAINALKVNMTRTKSMNREFFHRVKPDDVEFLALLGLSFWNKDVALVNEELSTVVQCNRDKILNEMHEVYKSRGKADYATRLGELFCLLDNVEENVTLSKHDIEVYRLLNLFNEAFPARCKNPEQE